MAARYIDGFEEELQTFLADTISACPDVMTAIVLAGAPASMGPEEQACARSVIEANTDLVRSALLDDDPDAAQEFGTLMASECPAIG